MRKRKILALLLASVMLLSIFSGCNAVEPDTVSSGSSVSSDASASTDSADTSTDSANSRQESTDDEDTTSDTDSDAVGDASDADDASGTASAESEAASSELNSAPDVTSEENGICLHKWSSWTTKDATCDVNGVKTRECSECGNKQTETIVAVGHNWDEGKISAALTDCSDRGVKTYACRTCGKTRTEQAVGAHSFGTWEYEEYTYKNEAGASRPSHRKVRSCTKCGYKEYGNTPDHYCAKGSANHTVSIIKEPICSAKGVKRSTCKICGWYVDFEYGTAGGAHTWVDKKVHLSDYTQYTNELDATISTCSGCGLESVTYHYGKGYDEYHRWRSPVTISQGNAYVGSLPVSDNRAWVDHPEWQMVTRDHVYDSEGYVKQFTVYWWYNGTRYSQVIKCDQASLDAWFAEYGLTGEVGNTFQLTVKGSRVTPYKITWRG